MTRRTAPPGDPDQLAAEAEAFRRELEAEAEAEASLARHPERRRFARAGSPDEHRRRVPPRPGRDPGRAGR